MAELLIEGGSKALLDFFTAAVSADEPPSMDTFIADDFCGVSYRINGDRGEDEPRTRRFRVEARFANLPECMAAGAKEVLDADYAGLVVASPDPATTVALFVDLDGSLPCAAEALPDLLSKLGRNVVGAPILLALRALKAGNLATMAPLKITTASNGQCMYVQTASDSVSVSYCLNCTDAADVAVAKVIMQEFSDARGGPSANWTTAAPAPGAPRSNVGYLTLKSTGKKSVDTTVTRLVYFPAYLDYHVKATKAFLHSRMRDRVGKLLKVLNRARPELLEKIEKARTGASRRGAGTGAGAGAGAGSRSRR